MGIKDREGVVVVVQLLFLHMIELMLVLEQIVSESHDRKVAFVAAKLTLRSERKYQTTGSVLWSIRVAYQPGRVCDYGLIHSLQV
jgi:Tfp pilus assembly protein PilX